MEMMMKRVMAVVMLAAVFATVSTQPPMPTCLYKVAPCKNAQNMTELSSCCSAVSELVSSDLPCLCSALKVAGFTSGELLLITTYCNISPSGGDLCAAPSTPAPSSPTAEGPSSPLSYASSSPPAPPSPPAYGAPPTYSYSDSHSAPQAPPTPTSYGSPQTSYGFGAPPSYFADPPTQAPPMSYSYGAAPQGPYYTSSAPSSPYASAPSPPSPAYGYSLGPSAGGAPPTPAYYSPAPLDGYGSGAPQAAQGPSSNQTALGPSAYGSAPVAAGPYYSSPPSPPVEVPASPPPVGGNPPSPPSKSPIIHSEGSPSPAPGPSVSAEALNSKSDAHEITWMGMSGFMTLLVLWWLIVA